MHLIFLSSCSKSEKSPEQFFLENVMIRHKGLYVLMGSKPMCCFDVEDPFSEKVKQRSYKNYIQNKQKDNSHEDPWTYEEYKKHWAWNEDVSLRFHHGKLWDIWMEKKNPSVSKCFKFVKRRSPFDPDIDVGYFINVPSATYILKKNYDLFLQLTGIDFDPMTILDEVSHNDSVFWEKVFQTHQLVGLLYGFGERNSFFFDWGAKNDAFPPSPDKVILLDPRYVNEFTAKISYKDLKLPLFGTYTVEDPLMENYKKERKYILKELKGKDFVDTVMQWLAGQP